jgi:DNA-binding MarR family transcriptional regulator
VTSDDSPATLAAEAWRAILDFVSATSWRRARSLADLGLTINDSRALTSLEYETGRTMRSLAAEWSCDASTATWIVDRLEQRGLAERRAHAPDRRLRLAVLTPAGLAMRDEMLRRLYVAPPELLDLDLADLGALRDGVVRLPTFTPAPVARFPQERPTDPARS